MMKLISLDGNPFIGIYAAAGEKIAFLPPNTPDAFRNDIRDALEVEIITGTLGDSTVAGSLIAMNASGALVTPFARDEEIVPLREFMEVRRLPGKYSAVGNNVLVNNKGAVINPSIRASHYELIKDVFDVEVMKMSIGGIKTVGSACLITDKGGLCHPNVTDEELETLSEFFKIPFVPGTLNYGTGYVGACALANSKGAVIGDSSTPIEMGKVEDALVLY